MDRWNHIRMWTALCVAVLLVAANGWSNRAWHTDRPGTVFDDEGLYWLVLLVNPIAMAWMGVVAGRRNWRAIGGSFLATMALCWLLAWPVWMQQYLSTVHDSHPRWSVLWASWAGSPVVMAYVGAHSALFIGGFWVGRSCSPKR